MRIYILSTYDEYGAENVKATTNKDKLMGMINHYFKGDVEKEKEKLIILIEKDELSGITGCDLSGSWGGVQLHIVESEE